MYFRFYAKNEKYIIFARDINTAGEEVFRETSVIIYD